MAGSTLKDSHETLLITITHSQVLTWQAAGRRPTVFNYRAVPAACPADGAMLATGHLLGGGGPCEQPEAGGLPGWHSGRITSHVPLAGPAARCHPWGRKLVWENERKGEKKNTQVWGFFFFSLELNYRT